MITARYFIKYPEKCTEEQIKELIKNSKKIIKNAKKWKQIYQETWKAKPYGHGKELKISDEEIRFYTEVLNEAKKRGYNV